MSNDERYDHPCAPITLVVEPVSGDDLAIWADGGLPRMSVVGEHTLWQREAERSPVITDRYLDIWESSEVATKGTVGPASWERVTYLSAVGASGRNWLAPVMVPEASGVIRPN